MAVLQTDAKQETATYTGSTTVNSTGSFSSNSPKASEFNIPMANPVETEEINFDADFFAPNPFQLKLNNGVNKTDPLSMATDPSSVSIKTSASSTDAKSVSATSSPQNKTTTEVVDFSATTNITGLSDTGKDNDSKSSVTAGIGAAATTAVNGNTGNSPTSQTTTTEQMGKEVTGALGTAVAGIVGRVGEAVKDFMKYDQNAAYNSTKNKIEIENLDLTKLTAEEAEALIGKLSKKDYDKLISKLKEKYKDEITAIEEAIKSEKSKIDIIEELDYNLSLQLFSYREGTNSIISSIYDWYSNALYSEKLGNLEKYGITMEDVKNGYDVVLEKAMNSEEYLNTIKIYEDNLNEALQAYIESNDKYSDYKGLTYEELLNKKQGIENGLSILEAAKTNQENIKKSQKRNKQKPNQNQN